MRSQVQLFCDPMDCQAPLSLGCPRQEYWSSCHSLLQGIFLTQGVNPCLLHWQVPPGKPCQSTEQCVLLRKDLKWSRKSLLIIINSYYCEKHKNAILVYFIEGLLIDQSDKANNQGRKWTNARLFFLFFFPFPSYSFHLPSVRPKIRAFVPRRKNRKLFCNSYGKSRKLFVQFSETSHRLLRHHPSLSCKFHKGRGWGVFPWPFHSLLFLCH